MAETQTHEVRCARDTATADIAAVRAELNKVFLAVIAEQILARAALSVLLAQLVGTADKPGVTAKFLGDALYRSIDGVRIEHLDGAVAEEVKELARIGVDVVFSMKSHRAISSVNRWSSRWLYFARAQSIS
jgi:hypothetical protein